MTDDVNEEKTVDAFSISLEKIAEYESKGDTKSELLELMYIGLIIASRGEDEQAGRKTTYKLIKKGRTEKFLRRAADNLYENVIRTEITPLDIAKICFSSKKNLLYAVISIVLLVTLAIGVENIVINVF